MSFSTADITAMLSRSPNPATRNALRAAGPAPTVSRPQAQQQARKTVVGPQGIRCNKLERAYAEHLDLQLRAGEIRAWRYECVRLRLAHGAEGQRGAWYTPDFMVWLNDGTVEAHETKGFMREAARLRVLFAAQQFPDIRFVVVRKFKGEWTFEKMGI